MTDQFRMPYSIWLDLETARLHLDNEDIALSPKSFALLNYLVTHPNQILTTQELLDAVWPNRYVNDTEVRHYIRKLRKVLGDNIKAPKFIETLHGKGYRFIGTIATRPPKISASTTVTRAVGRHEELAQLHDWQAQSLTGKCQVVLIIGDLGVGKTTLMKEFMLSLHMREKIYLARGQCIESRDQGEAFMPVMAALEDLCNKDSDFDIKDCLNRYAPLWLSQLPSQLDATGLEKLRERIQHATPARMLRELANALTMLTTEKGLILWLEDLHWSDTATLMLIDYLARRQLSARVMIIGTSRPLETAANRHPLSELHAELRLHQYCHELVLTPFSKATVKQYLDTVFPGLPPALSPILHRHTDGNPLFIAKIMEDLSNRNLIAETNDLWSLTRELTEVDLGIPDSLRSWITQRFQFLSEDKQQLLLLASVAGEEFSAALLAAALNWTVAAIEACCNSLVLRRQFLRRAGEERWPDGTRSGRYAFSHDLYRRALYEDTTPAWRQNAHYLLGTRLEQSYANPSEQIALKLAFHFENSCDFFRAVSYLTKASNEAFRRQATHEARRHLEKGLFFLDCLPVSPMRDRTESELLKALARFDGFH